MLLTVIGLLWGGSLADPSLSSEIPFSAVEREHFDAVGVVVERERAATGPLHVRVHIVGDAADADTEQAFEWLRENANIIVTRSADGAPLFLTEGDLSATSGRGTLGATVPEGMAVEVRDPRVSPCVVAHEVLHFVGLKHVKERTNIMYPHCSRDFLDSATFTQAQYEQVASVRAIRATTPGGVELWATR